MVTTQIQFGLLDQSEASISVTSQLLTAALEWALADRLPERVLGARVCCFCRVEDDVVDGGGANEKRR